MSMVIVLKNRCCLEMGREQQPPILKTDVLLTYPPTPTSSLHRLCDSVIKSFDFLLWSRLNSYGLYRALSLEHMSSHQLDHQLKQLIQSFFLGGQPLKYLTPPENVFVDWVVLLLTLWEWHPCWVWLQVQQSSLLAKPNDTQWSWLWSEAKQILLPKCGQIDSNIT